MHTFTPTHFDGTTRDNLCCFSHKDCCEKNPLTGTTDKIRDYWQWCYNVVSQAMAQKLSAVSQLVTTLRTSVPWWYCEKWMRPSWKYSTELVL
ncbi:hypothetical protein GDO78_010587 [Eleutherodactylus coqui]|uniref:Uncharacterized protein n=1 Tax=Eleutherodactylus coqui TaxID=57060 RepID=A0A8J6F649_ELECQ|nr:hypothetical protein GDO78_010587 [Eleutherodactylus coqui]